MKSHFCRTILGLAVALVVTSCSNQEVYVTRVAAPGGGYYVQRIVKERDPEAAKKREAMIKEVHRNVQEREGRRGGWFGLFGGRKPAYSNMAELLEDSGYWRGDGVEGKPSLTINLTEQKVFYYKGGQLVGMAPISSGREGHDTVVGTFKVIEKDVDHRSSLYGDYVGPDGLLVSKEVDSRKDPRPPGTKFQGAEMNYFMRITGAIGMHEGYLPGYPASHGCIRLPGRMAKIFYEATPMGTPVKIVR